MQGQDSEWTNKVLDSLVSIKFPNANVSYVSDPNAKIPFESWTAIYEGGFFIVQKSSLIGNVVSNPVVKDTAALNTFYNGYYDGLSQRLQSHKLKSKESIEIEGYIGKVIRFTNLNDDSNYEVQVLFVDKNLYSVIYKSDFNFDEKSRDLFFDSLILNKNKPLSQFTQSSTVSILGYKLGSYMAMISILLILALIIYFLYRITRSRKNIHA